jgi:branched-chain amino acid transport system substrate-binding protein
MLLLSGLSACAKSNTFTNQTPIKVGYTVSLTGSFSQDGNALQQGYFLWRDQINQSGGLLGRPVQLVYMDDKSDAATVTADYQTLITKDHVNLLFGPFSSLLAVKAATVAHKYNDAIFMPTGSATSVYDNNFDNAFVMPLPSYKDLEAFSYYILSLPQAIRPTTAAYVSVDSPFAQPEVQQAQNTYLGSYMDDVYSYTYETNANVAPIADRIAASKAQVVVLGTSGLSDSVAFIKEFQKDNYNPKAIVFTSGPDEGSQFLNAIGGESTAEGIFTPETGWYPGAQTYEASQFTSAYLARYSGTEQDISSTTAEAYAAGQVLQQAVTLTHSLDQATLIKGLHANTFNSVLGPMQFKSDGENTIGTSILSQWEKGQFIPVYPDTAAEANPEFPKSDWP